MRTCLRLSGKEVEVANRASVLADSGIQALLAASGGQVIRCMCCLTAPRLVRVTATGSSGKSWCYLRRWRRTEQHALDCPFAGSSELAWSTRMFDTKRGTGAVFAASRTPVLGQQTTSQTDADFARLAFELFASANLQLTLNSGEPHKSRDLYREIDSALEFQKFSDGSTASQFFREHQLSFCVGLLNCSVADLPDNELPFLLRLLPLHSGVAPQLIEVPAATWSAQRAKLQLSMSTPSWRAGPYLVIAAVGVNRECVGLRLFPVWLQHGLVAPVASALEREVLSRCFESSGAVLKPMRVEDVHAWLQYRAHHALSSAIVARAFVPDLLIERERRVEWHEVAGAGGLREDYETNLAAKRDMVLGAGFVFVEWREVAGELTCVRST